jgi:hypothetical protein
VTANAVIMDKQKKNLFLRLWHFTNRWIKLGLELVLFVVIVGKSVPAAWLDSGLFLFIILIVTFVGLLLTNFLLMWRAATIGEEGQRKYEQEKRLTNDLHNQQMEELRTKLSVMERKSRYVDAIPMLNSAFQELHSAIRRNHQDKAKYHEHLRICCHNLEKVLAK